MRFYELDMRQVLTPSAGNYPFVWRELTTGHHEAIAALSVPQEPAELAPRIAGMQEGVERDRDRAPGSARERRPHGEHADLRQRRCLSGAPVIGLGRSLRASAATP